MYVPNPLFDRGDLPSVSGLTTPSKPPLNNQMPLLSSTPFSHGDLEEEEDSTLRETTAFTMAQMNETYSTFEHNTVDVFVKNPLYGSELTLNKVRLVPACLTAVSLRLVTSSRDSAITFLASDNS